MRMGARPKASVSAGRPEKGPQAVQVVSGLVLGLLDEAREDPAGVGALQAAHQFQRRAVLGRMHGGALAPPLVGRLLAPVPRQERLERPRVAQFEEPVVFGAAPEDRN